MKKDVLIKVTGLQITEDEEEMEQVPIEILVPGQYFLRGDSHYLRYEEHMEDFKNPALNYVRYNGKTLEVRKQGLLETRMEFVPGERTEAIYKTPYGVMEIGLTTTTLTRQDMGEDRMVFLVKYLMDISGEYAADCTLRMEAWSKGSEQFEF